MMLNWEHYKLKFYSLKSEIRSIILNYIEVEKEGILSNV